MRKVGLFLLSLFCSILSKADIVFDVNKYGVMIVHFEYDEDPPSLEIFKNDWNSALNIASSKSTVKQIQFKDTKNETIAWMTKDNISNSNQIFEKMVDRYSTFDEVELVYGDSVWIRDKKPAQYHSDTYKDGKLISAYASDWSQGYFSPSSSTYTSGGATYKTKTYYTPAQYNGYWKKPIKERNVIKKGIEVKLTEIYKKRE